MKKAFHDSKSIMTTQFDMSLLQIDPIARLFHSQIDFVEDLNQIGLHLLSIKLGPLIMIHKKIRDDLVDIIHGNSITELVAYLMTTIEVIRSCSKQVILKCQQLILNGNSRYPQLLISTLWSRNKEYSIIMSQLNEFMSDSDYELVETYCKKVRSMIIDLHVLCQ